MDLFDEELISFWRMLDKHSVRYIMTGGVATNFNGYQRATEDIDLWIDDTKENRINLRYALKEYSQVDYFMLETLQIIPGWTSFNLNNGLRMDLMINVKGLENLSFNECYLLASQAEIDGIKVPFLHINHLIASKKAANRPKDQVDVIYLEKIKKIMEEEDPENG